MARRDLEKWAVYGPDGQRTGYQRRVDAPRDPLTGKRRQEMARGRTEKEFLAEIVRIQSSSPSQEMLFKDFLTNVWLPTKRDEGRVKASSLRGYKTAMARIIPGLGHFQLGQLEGRHINAWMSKLKQQGHKPNTIRSYLAVVRMATKMACVLRYTTYDASEGVRAPAAPAVTKDLWDEAELRTFLAHTRDHEMHALWWTLAMTGMRIGEALALAPENLDLANRVIKVRRTVSQDEDHGFVMGDEPKNSSSIRDILLDPGTVKVLRTVTPRVGKHAPRPVLFPFTEADALRQLRKVLAQLGWASITLHDLRHMHSTHLTRAKVPEAVIMARLGHSTPRMAAHYKHLTKLQDQMSAVRAVAGAAAGGRSASSAAARGRPARYSAPPVRGSSGGRIRRGTGAPRRRRPGPR
jgi:integrase